MDNFPIKPEMPSLPRVDALSGIYQYSKLATPDSFRLIVLQPSEQELGASLNCSIIHSTLEHYANEILDNYTALSYVWGDLKS